MIAGPWKSVAEFEAWWKANVVEFNRMAVATPPRNFEEVTNPEWHRIAEKIEALQAKRKRWEELDA